MPSSKGSSLVSTSVPWISLGVASIETTSNPRSIQCPQPCTPVFCGAKISKHDLAHLGLRTLCGMRMCRSTKQGTGEIRANTTLKKNSSLIVKGIEETVRRVLRLFPAARLLILLPGTQQHEKRIDPCASLHLPSVIPARVPLASRGESAHFGQRLIKPQRRQNARVRVNM